MQIIFNGKSYTNLEDMPANERTAYDHMQKIFVDANGNGIPDFLEGDVAKNVITAFSSNVNFNGQVYNNLNALPEPARKKVQEAFAKLSQLGIANAGNFTQPNTDTPNMAFQPSAPIIQPPQTTVGQSGPNRWLIVMASLAGMLLCALVIVMFFLLRN